MNKIREILKGIDKEEFEDNDGWWETSTGVEFGKKKLLEIENEFKKMQCCGNCSWNTRAIIHDRCDQNQWMTFSGKDRGRGFCPNWKQRKD